MMRKTAIFPLIAVLFSAALHAGGPPLPIPASGTYLGIWANPALGNPEAAIEVREGPAPNGINHKLALHLHYYAWKNIAAMLNNGVFQPDGALQGDIDHGRVPVISWVCDASMPNSDHVIATGDASEDAIITATARTLAQYPGPVLLRWFWEFNVLVNNQNCRGDTGGTPTQQVYTDFIGAWRHIRQLFQTAGATNVAFLWNPGHYTADGNADDPHGFYPGNDYVDWIGLDGYQDNTSETFATIVNLFYSDFSQAQYGGKPLMIGENGSQNYVQHNQEFQGAYLQALLADFQQKMFPRIKAYCYFDSVGARGNWVLDDNNGQGNGGLAAFAAMAASKEFSPLIVTSVSAASYKNGPLAPESIASGFGTDLATQQAPAETIPLPTSLAGTQVSIKDSAGTTHMAPLFFVSQGQVNYQVPAAAAPGIATLTVTSGDGSVSTGAIEVATVSPGLFSANADGKGVAAADAVRVASNGAQTPVAVFQCGSTAGSCVSVPIDLGPASDQVVLVLFGTGIRGRTSLSNVTCTVGGVSATVSFADAQSQFIGLDQVNVTLPRALAGKGEVQIIVTVDGQPSNAVTVNIK